MKFSFLLYFFSLFIIYSCKNKDQLIQTPDIWIADSINQPSQFQKCETFIKSFPNDFEKFIELYGYDDKNGIPKKLYSQYEEEIKHFFNCELMDESLRIVKTINISLNGTWKADAAGLFQNETILQLMKFTNEYIIHLNKLNEIHWISFWSFLMDGSPPGDSGQIQEYNNLKTKISFDSTQIGYLEMVYNKNKKND